MILSRLSVAFTLISLLQIVISPVLAQTDSTAIPAQNNTNPAQSNTHATAGQKKPALIKKRHLLKSGDAGHSKPISKLPPDFPAPIYPASVFDSANEVDGTGRQFYARFHVAASIDEVSAWYVNSFPSSGWVIANKPVKDPKGAIRIVATKNHNIGCTIRIDNIPKPKAKTKTKTKTETTKKPVETTNFGISVTIK